MSDAVIALISAMMTTIGLAVVNKMMSRPAERWKQAAEMREELRQDLTRAQGELQRIRERSETRDLQFLELKEQMIDTRIQLMNMSSELKQCHDKHKLVEEELVRVRAEFKTCFKAGGAV
jgi:hypothetical protein